MLTSRIFFRITSLCLLIFVLNACTPQLFMLMSRKDADANVEAEIEAMLEKRDYQHARQAMEKYPWFVNRRQSGLFGNQHIYGKRDWSRRSKHYKVFLAALPILEGNPRLALLQLDKLNNNECIPHEREWYRASALAGLGYNLAAGDILVDAILNISSEESIFFYRWVEFMGGSSWLSEHSVTRIQTEAEHLPNMSIAILNYWKAKIFYQKGRIEETLINVQKARRAADLVKETQGFGLGYDIMDTSPEKPGHGIHFEVDLLEAQCLLDLNKPLEAIPMIANAEEIAHGLEHKNEFVVKAYAMRALAESKAGHKNIAFRYINACQKYLKKIQHYETVTYTYPLVGKALWNLGEKEKAIEAYEKSIVIAEQIPTATMPVMLKAQFYARWRSSYHDILSMLVATNRLDKAFIIAERGKNRALIENLTMKSNYFRHNEKVKRLSERASVLRKQIAFEKLSNNDLENAKIKLLQLENQINEELAKQSRGTLSDYKSPLNPNNVSAELKPGQMAIVYQLLPNRSLGWAIGPNFVDFAFLPDEKEISKYCRRLYNSISDPYMALKNSSEWKDPAIWLYDHLIRPFTKERRPVNQWLIIPDGDLAGVPFEVFYDSERSMCAIDVAEVSYLPSVSILRYLPKTEFSSNGNILITSISKYAENSQNIASVSARGFDLGDLPYVDYEAQSILSVFGKDKVTWLKNEQASETNFKIQDLSKFNILHFACHALIPSETPWLSESALILNADSEKYGEDGLLMANEVETLDLKSEMVVLSACETAGGKYIEGNGFIGLATSFLSAGAKRLVVSQWNVSDKPTALLMKHFYQNLDKALSAGKALRSAKLWLRSYRSQDDELRGIVHRKLKIKPYISIEKTQNHPFFWAPFVLVSRP
jgi:CHAT domain-containing protein